MITIIHHDASAHHQFQVQGFYVGSSDMHLEDANQDVDEHAAANRDGDLLGGGAL